MTADLVVEGRGLVKRYDGRRGNTPLVAVAGVDLSGALPIGLGIVWALGIENLVSVPSVRRVWCLRHHMARFCGGQDNRRGAASA